MPPRKGKDVTPQQASLAAKGQEMLKDLQGRLENASKMAEEYLEKGYLGHHRDALQLRETALQTISSLRSTLGLGDAPEESSVHKGEPDDHDGATEDWSSPFRSQRSAVVRFCWRSESADEGAGGSQLHVSGQVADVEVNVAEDALQLVWPDGYLLRLPVGFSVDLDGCSVERSRRRASLILRIPRVRDIDQHLRRKALAEALAGSEGHGALDSFMSGCKLEALRRHLLELWQAGTYQPGEVEGEADWAALARSDSYRYIGEEDAVVKAFTRRLDRLVLEMMQEVPQLGSVKLMRGSPMAAVYAGAGSRYTPHFDSRGGNNGRILTCILYLNPFWRDIDGGQLRIWPEAKSLAPTGLCREFEPLHGRLVTFLCKRRNLHEVCPVAGDEHVEPRMAISCWYYDCLAITEDMPKDARPVPP